MANPVGRPPIYDPDFHPKDFIRRSKMGQHMYVIAYEWDLARDTIYDWANKHPEFSYAFKKGKELAESWYMKLGNAAMMGQATIDGKPVKVDLGFFAYLTKNKFKWSDRQTNEVSTPEKKKLVIQLTDDEDEKD